MREDDFDAIVIGGGPGGLFLAREIVAHSKAFKVALLDIGRSITRRVCPLIQVGDCTQCRICHVAYGIGGAGMYSDGKLSLWPAGSGLKEIFDNEFAVKEVNNYVMGAFLEHADGHGTRTGSDDNARLTEQASKADLHLKSYEVHHIGTEGIQAFCIDLEASLKDSGVTIFESTQCLDIEKFGDVFVVTSKNVRGQNIRMHSKRVVVATGKATGLQIRGIMNRLGVEKHYNSIDLGVRVETFASAVQGISGCHLDAKIKLQGDDGVEVRSFCMCNGGYLVSCYYDGFSDGPDRIATISGFSFRDKKSANGNFGVLVRRRFPDNVDAIAVQAKLISSVNSASGTGGTVVQRLGDFHANRATTHEGLENGQVKSTLQPVTPVNLKWLLPAYVTSAVETYLQHLGELSPQLLSDDTLLHAPVWELLNDRISVSRGMESTVAGLYVIGDASGWARGIIQAASTGVIAARHMLSTFV